MHNYKELSVWKKAIDQAANVYKLTQTLSPKDQYILSSQLSKCAISIPSNIAEGAGKDSDKDFCRYLSISEGSSFELETQLIITSRIIPKTKSEIDNILEELMVIQKMLYRLRNSYMSK